MTELAPKLRALRFWNWPARTPAQWRISLCLRFFVAFRARLILKNRCGSTFAQCLICQKPALYVFQELSRFLLQGCSLSYEPMRGENFLVCRNDCYFLQWHAILA